MKDILDVLAETMLLATFQPRRPRPTTLGAGERLSGGPSRFRPERKADRQRIW